MLYGREPRDGESVPPVRPAGGPPREAPGSQGAEPAQPAGLAGLAGSARRRTDEPEEPEPEPDLPDPSEPNPDDEPESPDPWRPFPDDPGEPEDPDGPDDPENPDEPEEDGEDEPGPVSPRARGVDPAIARRGGVSLGDAAPAPRKRRAPPPELPGGRAHIPPAESAPARDLGRAAARPERAARLAVPPPGASSADLTGKPVGAEDGGDSARAAENGAPAEFRPTLGSFDGPLELLLYLIHKDEIDIFDIPIARLLDQFLVHVQRAQEQGRLDLQQIGDYLVMAARLMEIKSRLLLPDVADEEEDLLEAEIEDPRWSLVEQLLEFREIKERAQLLEAAHRSRSQCFERIATDLPPPEPGSLDLGEASSFDLGAAFQRVLDLLRERDAVRIVPGEEIPIEEAMAGLRARLLACAGHRRNFSDLIPRELGLRGLISWFMALLELTRLRHLRLEQPDEYGDILVILREVA